MKFIPQLSSAQKDGSLVFHYEGESAIPEELLSASVSSEEVEAVEQDFESTVEGLLKKAVHGSEEGEDTISGVPLMTMYAYLMDLDRRKEVAEMIASLKKSVFRPVILRNVLSIWAGVALSISAAEAGDVSLSEDREGRVRGTLSEQTEHGIQRSGFCFDRFGDEFFSSGKTLPDYLREKYYPLDSDISQEANAFRSKCGTYNDWYSALIVYFGRTGLAEERKQFMRYVLGHALQKGVLVGIVIPDELNYKEQDKLSGPDEILAELAVTRSAANSSAQNVNEGFQPPRSHFLQKFDSYFSGFAEDRPQSLSTGGEVMRDGPSMKYKVQAGDTRKKILARLRGDDLFQYLKSNIYDTKTRGINVTDSHLKKMKGEWIFIPLPDDVRRIGDAEAVYEITKGIQTMKQNAVFGTITKKLEKVIGEEELVRIVNAVSVQESGRGEHCLYRYESDTMKSTSHFHVLTSGPSWVTGDDALRFLGMTEEAGLMPDNGTQLFLADIFCKIASTMSVDWGTDAEIYTKKSDSIVKKLINKGFCFNTKDASEKFASFYNGGDWKDKNPEYARNVCSHFFALENSEISENTYRGAGETVTFDAEQSEYYYLDYTVVAGDTLYGIVQKYGSSVEAIQQANEMGSSTLIKLGQVLRIPGSGTSPSLSR